MKELWRRTSYLFWQYPVLWVPVISVDLLGSGLKQAESLVTHAITMWWLHAHSQSLSGPNEPSLVLQTSMLVAPISWGVQIAAVCLYTTAMVWIGRLLGRLTKEDGVGSKGEELPISRYAKGIFNVSFQALASMMASMALFIIPALALSTFGSQAQKAGLLTHPIWFFIVTLIPYCVTAYLVTPAALRLLAKQGVCALKPDVLGRARVCSLLLGASEVVLGLLLRFAVPRFRGSAVAVAGVSVAESLMLSIPYIVLFIALNLLAIENRSDDFDTSTGGNNGQTIVALSPGAEAHSLR